MATNARYILDTDTCIYLLNGNESIKSKVRTVGINSIGIAIPTIAELYYGAYYSQRAEENLKRVQDFLRPPGPMILGIDETAAARFGKIKANLRRVGQLIDDFDMLIAGLALSQGLTIVTNNTDHFRRISGLSLENWLA